MTSLVNEVPGPISSWVARTRAALTTIVPDSAAAAAAGESAKVSWVGPWSVVSTGWED